MNFFVRDETNISLLQKINPRYYTFLLIALISLLIISWFITIFYPLYINFNWYTQQNKIIEERLTKKEHLNKNIPQSASTELNTMADDKKNDSFNHFTHTIDNKNINIVSYQQKSTNDDMLNSLTITCADTFDACTDFLKVLHDKENIHINSYSFTKDGANKLLLLNVTFDYYHT